MLPGSVRNLLLAVRACLLGVELRRQAAACACVMRFSKRLTVLDCYVRAWEWWVWLIGEVLLRDFIVLPLEEQKVILKLCTPDS